MRCVPYCGGCNSELELFTMGGLGNPALNRQADEDVVWKVHAHFSVASINRSIQAKIDTPEQTNDATEYYPIFDRNKSEIDERHHRPEFPAIDHKRNDVLAESKKNQY